MGQLTLGACAPPLKADLSQYHTPDWVAERMVEWSGVRPGMHVLEPSGGGGQLVRALTNNGARVTTVEIDPAWAQYLRDAKYPRTTVIEANFLETLAMVGDGFDMAAMNPPLNDGEGLVHVAHALQFAPRAVSVLRSNDMHGVKRHEKFWSVFDLAGLVHFKGRPFIGAKSEFVVVEVTRDKPGTAQERGYLRMEWW